MVGECLREDLRDMRDILGTAEGVGDKKGTAEGRIWCKGQTGDSRGQRRAWGTY